MTQRRIELTPTTKAHLAITRGTQILRSLKDPARACEGLNVAPAPSLRALQGCGGEQVEACEKKQRQFDENQQKYGRVGEEITIY